MPIRLNAFEVVPTSYIYTPSGSTPQPALHEDWTNLKKLNWLASLIMVKHPGLILYIGPGNYQINGVEQHDYYSLSYNGGGVSPMAYEKMWTALSFIDLGFYISSQLPKKEKSND